MGKRDRDTWRRMEVVLLNRRLAGAFVWMVVGGIETRQAVARKANTHRDFELGLIQQILISI